MNAKHTEQPILVSVVMRNIGGLIGFHARCNHCKWTSRGTESEKTAETWAKLHGKSHAKAKGEI